MSEIYNVILAPQVIKDLKRIPISISIKLTAWIEAVGHEGLRAVRKISGYHDEPLLGKRKGQRSIRLNRAYRAIYVIKENSLIEFVEIMEINKHEY